MDSDGSDSDHVSENIGNDKIQINHFSTNSTQYLNLKQMRFVKSDATPLSQEKFKEILSEQAFQLNN